MVDKALMQLIAIDRDQASRNSTWRDLLNQNASALEAAIKQCERDAKDAARYRWWRRNARAIEQDEAGLDGLAFNSQVPLETIENASDEELFDLIADAAMAEESGQ